MTSNQILEYIKQVAIDASNCDLQNYYEAYYRQFDTLLLYWKELNIDDDNWQLELDEDWFSDALIRVVDRIMDLECNNIDFANKESQYVKQKAIACLGSYNLLLKIRSFSRHESLDNSLDNIDSSFNDLSLLNDEELRQIIDTERNG